MDTAQGALDLATWCQAFSASHYHSPAVSSALHKTNVQ